MPRARERRQSRLREGEFAKYHALGNDYLVIDAERFGTKLTRARVRSFCTRHTGAGSDGLLALAPSSHADFGVRIFNPDGSEAEKSGNGVRILARFLRDFGYTRRTRFSIETKGGVVHAELSSRRDAAGRISVDMGKVTFWSHKIPVRGPRREVINERLRVGSRVLRATCLSIGNPHCVIFERELGVRALQRLGALIEHHPMFPKRSNVQFVRVATRKRLEALIWERGAGETQASGSSACAIAAAAYRTGLADRRVQVQMPGGKLSIEIGDDLTVHMTGPATPVYRGIVL